MMYYADCRPHRQGCRNCGGEPQGRMRYYCSDECRDAFDASHFWGTARRTAVERGTVIVWKGLSGDWVTMQAGHPAGFVCARCQTVEAFTPEVNHIQPVNGNRPHFGCCHHQENLEVVCHPCHLEITREQRAAGLIGLPLDQRPPVRVKRIRSAVPQLTMEWDA